MPDREKVIKGLEVCTSKPCYCTDCPYKANCCLDSQEVMEDALALLKEQEETIRNLEQEIRDKNERLKERAEQVDSMLKEKEKEKSLLGIQQTADGITFISTGTAQQGEERGIMLGKSYMHEWLKKELIHRGLMTNEIRDVFRSAEIV